MYNIRIFDYPTGFQVRTYNKVLDLGLDYDVDFFTGELKPRVKKSNDKLLPVDEWIPTDLTFEEIGQELDRKAAHSLASSMSRTKNNLYYIARSNIWEWFITFTLNPAKVDRYDYKACSKKVRVSFNHMQQRKASSLRYLVVPEQHKDGAWHFHGLLSGSQGLNFEDSGNFDKKGRRVFYLLDYKAGFTTATKVTDSAKAASYICKYITKSLCGQTKGLQRYFVSKNCDRSPVYKSLMDYKDLQDLKESFIRAGCWSKSIQSDYVTTDYFELPKDLFELELKKEEGV